MSEHRWDEIRRTPTVITAQFVGSKGAHESLLRSYKILREVQAMLARGDSVETIRDFIAWCETTTRADAPD